MSPARQSPSDRALEVAQRHGIARARDFAAAGVAPLYIKQLTEEGRLIRLGRGLYQLPERAGVDANHDLAEVAKRVPSGVICLLSALRFHEMTTQLPNRVWLMIPHKARAPKLDSPALEIVRASSPAVLQHGLDHVDIEGVQVPITSPAKTVADCFKYRTRIGADVAVEALQDALRQRKAKAEDLMRYAAIDRVAAIMRPYVEALT